MTACVYSVKLSPVTNRRLLVAKVSMTVNVQGSLSVCIRARFPRQNLLLTLGPMQ